MQQTDNGRPAHLRVSAVVGSVVLIVGVAAFASHRLAAQHAPRPYAAPRPIPTPAAPPQCPSPSSGGELGSPGRGSARYAAFTTDGSELFVAVRYFSHDGPLDPLFGPIGRAAINVGPIATPPVYDAQRGTVSHTLQEINVAEGTYGSLRLPPGRYWLLTSNGREVVVASCTPQGVRLLAAAG